MPNTVSAKKALRQNKRRHTQNLLKKTAYKDAIKTYKKLLAENKTKETSAEIARIYKALDKAAKTNVIAKNKASRLKSRLAKKAVRS